MFTFMDQVSENVRFNLLYPYHINLEKLVGRDYYNPEFSDSYHCHTFEDVLRKAYMEPKAFYLTDGDLHYYSVQELEFIHKVIADESRKIDEGMEMVTIEVNDETLEMLEEYKAKFNLTFEEAVVDILKRAIANPELLNIDGKK